jgi:hypothetical protein
MDNVQGASKWDEREEFTHRAREYLHTLHDKRRFFHIKAFYWLLPRNGEFGALKVLLGE